MDRWRFCLVNLISKRVAGASTKCFPVKFNLQFRGGRSYNKRARCAILGGPIKPIIVRGGNEELIYLEFIIDEARELPNWRRNIGI